MPVQIYIAPQQGDGGGWGNGPPWTPTTGPFRSILHDLIDAQAGDRFSEYDFPARRISICTVTASTATLDAIDADGRATAVLPLRADDQSALIQILNTPFSSYKKPWRDNTKAFLEGHGVDCGWLTGASTMRDLIRFVVKLFGVAQISYGRHLRDVSFFLRNNLDDTVGAIPEEQRTAMANWLTERGVDVSWVTSSTPLREVVRVLPGNLRKLYGREVKLPFAGEML